MFTLINDIIRFNSMFYLTSSSEHSVLVGHIAQDGPIWYKVVTLYKKHEN